MDQIPEKINLFNVYKDGIKLIGLSDEITLPDFEAMTETISGPGILGEIDSPTIGHFSSMEVELPFRNLDEHLIEVFEIGEGVNLTLRASQQYQKSTGGVDYKGMRVVMRGMVKGITTGSAKQGSPMGSSIKLELTYIMIEVSNQKMVELDKLNCIYIVNGKDMMEKARSLC